MLVASVIAFAAPTLAAQPPVAPGPPVTAADIRFMQDMIGHHQQAVDMSALLPTRTRRSDMKTLGERISVSQSDEIALMRRWLLTHGATVPAAVSHPIGVHDIGATSAMPTMPGMLSMAQMTRLRAARGSRFDRLFLQGMIQHHLGALAMVDSLMATPGAAQESALNRFVRDIDTDQRAEIRRMRRLLPRT